jgi:PilZ domain-containing protein
MERYRLDYPPYSVPSSSWLQDFQPNNRRQYRRYPITLEAEYKLLHEDRALPRRSGTTLNISSGGVLFKTDAPDTLPIDASIELLMRWPFRLDGVRPLNLVVLGSVIRHDVRGVAVKITRYEFRTVPERFIAKNATI